jgi:hypothetical protein
MPRSGTSPIHRSLIVNQIRLGARNSQATSAAIPEEETVRNFQFHQWGHPSRALLIHSNCLTPTVGVYSPFGHSFIYDLTSTVGVHSPFGHSFIYGQYRKLVLGTWVDTWTHTGINHSIGQLHRHHRFTTTKLQVGVLRYRILHLRRV